VHHALKGAIRLDLALFNIAIDSKLRGCDVVRLKVEDIAPNGYAASRAMVRQKKTGHPVRFEITEQARLAFGVPAPVRAHINSPRLKPQTWIRQRCTLSRPRS
jgi:hypothetical protein